MQKIRIINENGMWRVKSESGVIAYTSLNKAYEKALEIYQYRVKLWNF